MDESLFSKFKQMPIDSIMTVGEVKLVEPKESKRKNDQEFDFTFLMNTFADPEWREIFQKHYGSEKAKFHGSEFTLTCRPTDLESEVSKVKLLIMSTTQDYRARRESLISAVGAKREEERIAALNKNIENNEVDRMFKNLKV